MFIDNIIKIMLLMIIGLGVAWSLDKKTKHPESDHQVKWIEWAY